MDYIFCEKCELVYDVDVHGLQCPHCIPKNDVPMIEALKELLKTLRGKK